MQNMDDKVMDQLPWYANNTLDDETRQWVASQLDSHPAYRAQVSFYERLRAGLRAGVWTPEPTAGLDAVLARLDSRPHTAQIEPERREQASVIAFLRRALAWKPLPRLAYGIGLSVILIQAGMIGLLATRGNDAVFSEVRSRAQVAAAAGPFIKVSFRPGAAEADVRFLLVSVGASIVGGPSQLGDYYQYLESKRTDWAAQQIRISPIVESVAVIATLPPAKEE
jgi:hypothetical protein